MHTCSESVIYDSVMYISYINFMTLKKNLIWLVLSLLLSSQTDDVPNLITNINE